MPNVHIRPGPMSEYPEGIFANFDVNLSVFIEAASTAFTHLFWELESPLK